MIALLFNNSTSVTRGVVLCYASKEVVIKISSVDIKILIICTSDLRYHVPTHRISRPYKYRNAEISCDEYHVFNSLRKKRNIPWFSGGLVKGNIELYLVYRV